MIFKPDTSKQAQEVILSRKVKVTADLQLAFNNNPAYLLKPRTSQNEPKPAKTSRNDPKRPEILTLENLEFSASFRFSNF